MTISLLITEQKNAGVEHGNPLLMTAGSFI